MVFILHFAMHEARTFTKHLWWIRIMAEVTTIRMILGVALRNPVFFSRGFALSCSR